MDYDSTFRFLRCGLSPLTTEETDHLDNYVVAKGKKGYRSYAQEWKSPLRYSDLVAVNEAKDKFVASIKEFFQALRGGKKDGSGVFGDFVPSSCGKSHIPEGKWAGGRI